MQHRSCRLALAAMLIVALPPFGGRAAEQRRLACLGAGETRDAIQAHKMVPPVRAVTEAMRGNPGESIGIRLCRLPTLMVYDVEVLRHDGRLVHVLVDAGTGLLIPARAD